jgi:lipopolysaccharide assembly protein A
MSKTKGIVIGILVILALIILIQNSQIVTMRFLFWQISMSQIIWIIFTLIIGFVIGYIFQTVRKK